MSILSFVLVGLSGFASLVYEMAWMRRATSIFGSSALAAATVMAVFLLGLGLGSAWFGQRAGGWRRPLLGCVLIELLLAVNGAAGSGLFAAIEGVYGWMCQVLGFDSPVLPWLRVPLVAALLLPPAFLMGGTLPLFCRHWIRRLSGMPAQFGGLYAANTAGAALGCLAAGFALLPFWGWQASLHSAAAINVGLAVAFYFGASRADLPDDSAATLRRDSLARRSVARLAWHGTLLPNALTFLVGAQVLATELVWARFLTHFIRASVYGYPLALGVVLAGTAVGAAVASRGQWRTRRGRLLRLAALQAGSGLLLLAMLLLPASFWMALQAWGVGGFALLMAPGSILAGAAFPIINRLGVRRASVIPSRVGSITAWNTAGCVVGSLATGFVLLPTWGLAVSIGVASGVALLAACLALGAGLGLRWPRRPAARAGIAGLAGTLGLWALLSVAPPVAVPRDFMAPGERLIDLVEGLNSNLAVVQRGNYKTLLIDRLWQGVDVHNYQVFVAHIPMLLHSDARDVLVVGLGAGTTASRFLAHPINRLDIVDLEPALFAFTRKHFASAWMDDPRVRTWVEDGRSFIRHANRRYDLISVEVGQLDRPGVGRFYTRDFYRDVRARLRADGMLAQFVPLRFLKPADLAGLLKTFLDEFPNARLWYNTDELLLMGDAGKPRQLLPNRFEALMRQPTIAADFNYSYWDGAEFAMNRLAIFLAGFLATGTELRALADSAPAEADSDDRLRLTYSVADYRPTDRRVMALVPLLREHLSPLAAVLPPDALPAGTLAAAERVRAINVADIAAADVLGQLDRVPAVDAKTRYQVAREALDWNPRNVNAQLQIRAAVWELNGAEPGR